MGMVLFQHRLISRRHACRFLITNPISCETPCFKVSFEFPIHSTSVEKITATKVSTNNEKRKKKENGRGKRTEGAIKRAITMDWKRKDCVIDEDRRGYECAKRRVKDDACKRPSTHAHAPPHVGGGAHIPRRT